MQESTSSNTNIAINISFPILFLLISIFWTVWFSFSFKKKKLSSRIIINWLVINVVSLTLSLYLLIVGIINITDIKLSEGVNFINYITKHLFGLDQDWAWIIWVVLVITFISMNISISVMIRISDLNKKIDELNRSLAIIKGKLVLQNSSYDEIKTSEISLEDYKRLLDEYLAKEKLRIKYEKKISDYREKFEMYGDNQDIKLNTKTLLGITDKINLPDHDENNKTRKKGKKH